MQKQQEKKHNTILVFQCYQWPHQVYVANQVKMTSDMTQPMYSYLALNFSYVVSKDKCCSREYLVYICRFRIRFQHKTKRFTSDYCAGRLWYTNWHLNALKTRKLINTEQKYNVLEPKDVNSNHEMSYSVDLFGSTKFRRRFLVFVQEQNHVDIRAVTKSA